MKLLHRAINVLNARGPLVFLTPCVFAIGNCSEEIRFALVRARREGKKLVILRPYELPWKFRFPVTNREIFNIVSDHATELPAPATFMVQTALTAIYGTLHAVSLILAKVLGPWAHLPGRFTHPCLGATTLWKHEEEPARFDWQAVDRFRWIENLQDPLPVSLQPRKKELATKLRNEMGLPESAWFACLHVREPGFYPKERDRSRNATISNFIPLIQEITSRGGWVVRLGDKTMAPLPPMDRLIDYPHTRFKSDLMDLYLIKECRYYVGMSSGIFDTADLFEKPMLITNIPNFTLAYPRRPNDRGILKHVYSKSKGRFLSIQELLRAGWDVQHRFALHDEFVMYENTPDELLDAVREFLDPQEPTSLQREFNALRIQEGQKLLAERFMDGHYNDMHNRYRYAARLESSNGFVGAKFLQANWSSSSRQCADTSMSAKC